MRMPWVEKNRKINQRGRGNVYQALNEKKNYHRILCIKINLDSKFQLQQTILIPGTNFKKNYTSGRKHKKMDIAIEFFMFELVSVPIFSLN